MALTVLSVPNFLRPADPRRVQHLRAKCFHNRFRAKREKTNKDMQTYMVLTVLKEWTFIALTVFQVRIYMALAVLYARVWH